VIDFPGLEGYRSLRAKFTKALISLSQASGLHPECFSISSQLEHIGEYAVVAGGYGDVWKGRLRGQEVSIKILKVYRDSEIMMLLKVTIVLVHSWSFAV
jgi:hypothetical protein